LHHRVRRLVTSPFAIGSFSVAVRVVRLIGLRPETPV
jgi:hypothetical protein